ncbi:putative ribosomal protein [Staphylotrichum tortipilum]|uniref:Large ribosomal subunit protein bL21m n=1 Tax=Staphylotrichum tortipilum TaxID=2831512 RepID=A0AAN6MJ85_9PEZI|nr:putative ribosomal protein [Staphylotrichum longicolle]
MSRALLRSVLELRSAPVSRLVVPFLRPSTITTPPTPLPAAATSSPPLSRRLFNTTAQHVEPLAQQDLPPTDPITAALTGAALPRTHPTRSPTAPRVLPTAPTTPLPTTPLSPSVVALLPALAAQPGHYISVHIHGRPYLVTQGDSIRLPFRMPGVVPGDVLRLDRASVLGSRDLTLRGAPHVDPRLFECRAVVTGTEAEPERVMVKKKRRCRRAKHVRSQHRYTMLRVCELRVCAEAVEQQA